MIDARGLPPTLGVGHARSVRGLAGVLAVIAAACADEGPGTRVCEVNAGATGCEADGAPCGFLIGGLAYDEAAGCVRDEVVVFGCTAPEATITGDVSCATYDGPAGTGVVRLATGSFDSTDEIVAAGGHTGYEIEPCDETLRGQVLTAPECAP